VNLPDGNLLVGQGNRCIVLDSDYEPVLELLGHEEVP
jgi:hypothetical protein